MKVCIPIDEDQGLASPVCEHFGSAPMFMIADTATETARAIPNRNQHHGHGMCRPLQALDGQDIEGIVVGGIGRGALDKLTAADVSVFQSPFDTVAETLEALKAGQLEPVTPDRACAHHGHGGGGRGRGGGGR